MTKITCKRCGVENPVCHGRYKTFCKKCQSKEANENILKRFGTYRNCNLFRKYGIFQEDYDRMYEEQNGLCFICNKDKTLVVDHNHKTGKVRKLLCSNCNSGIGRFEYDPSLFDKAKEYVLNE